MTSNTVRSRHAGTAARTGRRGLRSFGSLAAALALLAATASPAQAATGSAVAGKVRGTITDKGSPCAVLEPEHYPLLSSISATITTKSLPNAHIDASVCFDAWCADPDGEVCYTDFLHGSFKITKGGRSIRGVVDDGSAGPILDEPLRGFGLHLLVKRGDRVLASAGSHLKFSGYYTPRGAMPFPMKGKVAVVP